MCISESLFSPAMWVLEGSQQPPQPAVLICMRQEGSLSQHYLVAGVSSDFLSLKFILGIFKYLSTAQFGKKFLGVT